jgi:hypothetical protein
LDIVPESAATKDAPARKGDAVFLTPDMFMQRNDPYFKTNGFFERSIVKRADCCALAFSAKPARSIPKGG